jgi:hypothetical protein
MGGIVVWADIAGYDEDKNINERTARMLMGKTEPGKGLFRPYMIHRKYSTGQYKVEWLPVLVKRVRDLTHIDEISMIYNIVESETDKLVYYQDSSEPASSLPRWMVQDFELLQLGKQSRCVFCGKRVLPDEDHDSAHDHITTTRHILRLFTNPRMMRNWPDTTSSVKWVHAEFRRQVKNNHSFRNTTQSLDRTITIRAPLALLAHAFLSPDDTTAVIVRDPVSGLLFLHCKTY